MDRYREKNIETYRDIIEKHNASTKENREISENESMNSEGIKNRAAIDSGVFVKGHTIANFYDSISDKRLTSSTWFERYKDASETDFIERYINQSNSIISDVDRLPLWHVYEDIGAIDIPVCVIIGLNGTDRQIKQEFSRWLERTRAIHKYIAPKEGYYCNKLKKWSSMAILPYYDLVLISRIRGCKYKLEEINEAIYPRTKNYTDGGFHSLDRLRKTIKAEVDHIFCAATLISMKNDIMTDEYIF